jgi:deoxyguanosine kinase
MRHRLLTIEGNIGSGKTTLATLLARDFGRRTVLEQFADNPFLPRFYSNPERYAFPLELYFMAERFQQLRHELAEQDLFAGGVVTDYMFTKSLLFARVTLGSDEYKLYKRLFDIISPTLPHPDLIVYLYAPVGQLLANIKLRGRSYEQGIQAEYLERLQETYLDYFRQNIGLKVLVVDTRDVDFVSDPKHYRNLTDLIDRDYAAGVHYFDLGLPL